MVLDSRAVGMLLRGGRRHEGLSREKNMYRFMFLLEMCSDLRMVLFT